MYDENGAPNTVYYYNNSTSATKYYYVLNLQGDVTEIRSTSNALVAQYNYDAFGNILSIKDANGNNITSSTHIANVNPLRYRGYFYDSETGFYYLNSRYYDPATRRFISADSVIDTSNFQGLNLYSYCRNNPVMYYDPNGKSALAIIGLSALLAGTLTLFTSSSSETTTIPPVEVPDMDSGIEFNDPVEGEPGTKDEWYDDDGNLVKERWYGPDGKAAKDRHYTDHGHPKQHPWPVHDHDWGYNDQGNWAPGPGYEAPTSGSSNHAQVATGIAGAAGAAVIGYGIYTGIKWIVAGICVPATGGGSLVIAGVMP